MSYINYLIEFTDKPESVCQKSLDDCKGHFWKALYSLCLPEEKKSFYVDQLDINDPLKSIELIKQIEEFYYNNKYQRIWYKKFFQNQELEQILGNDWQIATSMPEPNEIEKYDILLTSDNKELVIEILKTIFWIDPFIDPLITKIKTLMKHKNDSIVNEAFKLARPHRIEAFLPELLINLKKNKYSRNYTILQMLKDESVIIYDELVPYIKELAKDDDLQIRDLAQDILINWGIISKAEAEQQEKEKIAREKIYIQQEILSINSTKRLHAFVDKFNWDNGVEYMKAAANHPLCERGTAMMIYWRSDPSYYLKYNSVEDDMPDYERDTMKIQLLIETRIKEEFYNSKTISFDPTNDNGINWIKERNSEEDKNKRKIPDFMIT